MKRLLGLVSVILLTYYLISCTSNKNNNEILLSTTTSTDNSGLLDYLIPYFEKDTGITVKWIAVGTGAAIEMGKTKEADILMVHDKTRELQFMADGYGIKRSDLMYNDFVIVGPQDSKIDSSSLTTLLNEIKDKGYTFTSRGDNSGTHSKEKQIWQAAGITDLGDWYIETGQGMGPTLSVTSESEGYTLTDRATFLTMKDELDLKIIYENDDNLFNQYSVIVVMPHVDKNMNYEDALVLYEWLISSRGQTLINEFGKDDYGQKLFFANAED